MIEKRNIVYSVKEPKNPYDLWFTGQVIKFYKEGEWVTIVGCPNIDEFIKRMPIADKETAGFIKIGEGFIIEKDGTISVDFPDLPIADKENLGIVSIGDNINIEDGKISVNNASYEDKGVVSIGENIKIVRGKISVNQASYNCFGVVKPGTGLTIIDDRLSVDDTNGIYIYKLTETQWVDINSSNILTINIGYTYFTTLYKSFRFEYNDNAIVLNLNFYNTINRNNYDLYLGNYSCSYTKDGKLVKYELDFTNYTFFRQYIRAKLYKKEFSIGNNIIIDENNKINVPTSSKTQKGVLQPNSDFNIEDGILSLSENIKDTPNGFPTLDEEGKIKSSQLPSYVDDVLEYDSKDNFPIIGEKSKIYVDTNSDLTYRWSGTQYTEISKSLALGETSSTAYAGDKGKKLEENIEVLKSYNLGKTVTVEITQLVNDVYFSLPLPDDIENIDTINIKCINNNINYTFKRGYDANNSIGTYYISYYMLESNIPKLMLLNIIKNGTSYTCSLSLLDIHIQETIKNIGIIKLFDVIHYIKLYGKYFNVSCPISNETMILICDSISYSSYSLLHKNQYIDDNGFYATKFKGTLKVPNNALIEQNLNGKTLDIDIFPSNNSITLIVTDYLEFDITPNINLESINSTEFDIDISDLNLYINKPYENSTLYWNEIDKYGNIIRKEIKLPYYESNGSINIYKNTIDNKEYKVITDIENNKCTCSINNINTTKTIELSDDVYQTLITDKYAYIPDIILPNTINILELKFPYYSSFMGVKQNLGGHIVLKGDFYIHKVGLNEVEDEQYSDNQQSMIVGLYLEEQNTLTLTLLNADFQTKENVNELIQLYDANKLKDLADVVNNIFTNNVLLNESNLEKVNELVNLNSSTMVTNMNKYISNGALTLNGAQSLLYSTIFLLKAFIYLFTNNTIEPVNESTEDNL